MTDVFMDHGDGKELLLECTNILDSIGLKSFLMYGTALGAYRDKGFTPTESDIDIGFLTEQFIPKVPVLMDQLIRNGYEVHALIKPFNRCWAIKARKNNIGVDFVSFTIWTDQVHGDNVRFCVSTLAEFSGVYQRPMLEEYETVEIFSFGNVFLVPSPIEKYLELEYGENWGIPQHDHIQRTRVNQFRASRGIPDTHLDRYNYEL